MYGGEFGEAAVGVGGDALPAQAVVVLAGGAVHALPAMREALHRHRIADGETGDAGADLGHDAAGLVTRGRGMRLPPGAEVGMQVAAADAGTTGVEQHLPRLRPAAFHLPHFDFPDPRVNRRLHVRHTLPPVCRATPSRPRAGTVSM